MVRLTSLSAGHKFSGREGFNSGAISQGARPGRGPRAGTSAYGLATEVSLVPARNSAARRRGCSLRLFGNADAAAQVEQGGVDELLPTLGAVERSVAPGVASSRLQSARCSKSSRTVWRAPWYGPKCVRNSVSGSHAQNPLLRLRARSRCRCRAAVSAARRSCPTRGESLRCRRRMPRATRRRKSRHGDSHGPACTRPRPRDRRPTASRLLQVA